MPLMLYKLSKTHKEITKTQGQINVSNKFCIGNKSRPTAICYQYKISEKYFTIYTTFSVLNFMYILTHSLPAI